MSESWVINASPVILLAKAGLMELVPTLAGSLIIPEPVAAEILSVRGEDTAARWLTEAGKEFVHPAVAELPQLSGSTIGSGERSVVSWAAAHRGSIAVLDDRQARMIAARFGVKVIGTVGVVLRLKKSGLIPEAKPCLLQIKRVGGYIGDELFQEALRRVGELP